MDGEKSHANVTPVVYAPQIESRQVRFVMFQFGSEDDPGFLRPVYRESFFAPTVEVDHGQLSKVIIDISLMPDTEPESDSETGELKSYIVAPFGMIYSVLFKLYEPFPAADSSEAQQAATEAILRARIAVADFVYSCGGDEARKYYIKLQRAALGMDENTED